MMHTKQPHPKAPEHLLADVRVSGLKTSSMQTPEALCCAVPCMIAQSQMDAQYSPWKSPSHWERVVELPATADDLVKAKSPAAVAAAAAASSPDTPAQQQQQPSSAAAPTVAQQQHH